MQARIGQNRQNQIFVTRRTCRARRHRHQRVIGHARRYSFPTKTALGRCHESILPRPPAQPNARYACTNMLLNALRQSIRQLCRTHVLCIVRQIFVFKIVVAIRRFDLHQWRHVRRCSNPISRRSLRVLQCIAQSKRACRSAMPIHTRLAVDRHWRNFAAPTVEPSSGGLTNSGKPVAPQSRPCPPVRHAQAPRISAFANRVATKFAWCVPCPSPNCWPTPTAGVRNAEQFQRALHRAIFAKAAMQNNERTIKTSRFRVKQFAPLVSNKCASTPFFTSAACTIEPDLSDTCARRKSRRTAPPLCPVVSRRYSSCPQWLTPDPIIRTFAATPPIEPAPMVITTSPFLHIVGNRLRHLRHLLDKQMSARPCRDAQSVSMHDHPPQQSPVRLLNTFLNSTPSAPEHSIHKNLQNSRACGVAVRLECQHDALIRNAPRAALKVAAISTG